MRVTPVRVFITLLLRSRLISTLNEVTPIITLVKPNSEPEAPETPRHQRGNGIRHSQTSRALSQGCCSSVCLLTYLLIYIYIHMIHDMYIYTHMLCIYIYIYIHNFLWYIHIKNAGILEP